MKRFTIIGTVPDFRGPEFLMPAENAEELDAWIKSNRIDTHFTRIDGRPAIKIRGDFAAQCHPATRIRHTIEYFDRSDGRRIRAVSVEPL